MTAVVVLQGGDADVVAAAMAVLPMPARRDGMLVLEEKAATLLRARNKDNVIIIVVVANLCIII